MTSEAFEPCTLDDLADFRNGKGLSSTRYTDTGANPVFGSNGQIARTNELLNPDPVIVIGRVGAFCGSVHRVPEPSWVTDNAIVARPKEDVDIRFLYYRLISLDLNRTAIGSAQPLLTQSGLKVVSTYKPVLESDQRTIAHILGTLDDKIELNRRMNETLEAMARAIFKSWFVDFDPVRAKLEGRQPPGLSPELAALFPDSFEDSELGEIPKGWAPGCVAEVGENIRDVVKPGEVDHETAYIGLEHMPRGSIALGSWGAAAEVSSNKSAFETGDILFGKLRPYFHKVGVAPVPGVSSTDVLVLRPLLPEHFGQLLGVLSSVEFINYVDAASTGTRMPRTNWGDMGKYPLVTPPRNVSSAFTGRIVDPLVQRIRVNLHESQTLAATRDTLLPRLLSGELSVLGEIA